MADAIVPLAEEQEIVAIEATEAIVAVQGRGSGRQSSATRTRTKGQPNRTGNALAVDTAQLSETAQVALLEQQGLTVSEIAYELGIPATEVESDLVEVVDAQQAANSQGAAAARYSRVGED
jgi:hypothetical protein